MKTFKRLCVGVFMVFLLLVLGLDIYLLKNNDTENGFYRVEARRLARQIEETGSADLSGYRYITGVYSEADGDIYASDEHYVIINAGGRAYRAEYRIDGDRTDIAAVNIVLAAVFLTVMFVLIYIYRKIILPFQRLTDIPKELAKGNLAAPIPEEKSRFFGGFAWGVNMLRETIEESRQKELSVQKDKKLLLLSLSHDIKTPLSAIKLNAKALERGLYSDEERRRSAAESIVKHADEIEGYMAEITRAASEDLMEFDITEEEGFLAPVIDRIKERYTDRLSLSGTEFSIGAYENILLACDPDRLGECLQNLIENAIKYGDGKRISIAFDRIDGCQTISVENTGCTLNEDELTVIFDSFHRGSNTSGVQGNGLGLYICRRLMNKMGGEAYAEIKDGCFCAVLVVKIV